MKKTLFFASLFMAATAVSAQTIDFEDASKYKSVGVWDSWEESPFRTGRLEGNVEVVANHLNYNDEVTGEPLNPSARILAFQRSRYASNQFGVRVDLAETFELTTTTKYVHVYMHKPVKSRTLLILLGKRRERTAQSTEVEQIKVMASNEVADNDWYDAVFPVKGAGGIDIYSIVVVPDCESTNIRTEDFACYFDNIVVNDDSQPRIVHGFYPLNFDPMSVSAKSGNFLNSISLAGSLDGAQTIEVGNSSPQYIYRDKLSKSFSARPGETLTPKLDFTSNWMNGYVYLDKGQDGQFNALLNENYTIAANSDIMSYSYVETVANTEGYTSDGKKISGNARNVLNPPAFTLPLDLQPGYYRMRFKVDWGSIEPGGCMAPPNTIIQNGGAMVDVRLNIHGDEISVNDNQLNGEVLAEDGSKLNNYKATWGKPFTILVAPEKGFTYSGVKIIHGYNLNQERELYGTPQWDEITIPAYLFKDNKYTLPAELVDGDVMVQAFFVQDYGEEAGGDYPVKVEEGAEITNPEHTLSSIVFKSVDLAKTITSATLADYKGIYKDMRQIPQQLHVERGNELNVTITTAGTGVHAYAYIDLNQDGKFQTILDSEGKPALSGELLAYSYFNGRNSRGETVERNIDTKSSLPSFTVPADLPCGVYRLRLKVDVDNNDAGGSGTIAENGGFIADFLLNVHKAEHKLEVNTRNGNVYAASATSTTSERALPLVLLPYSTKFTAYPTAVKTGYVCNETVVRHGHNIDGPKYVHGNKQWEEFSFATKSKSLPADSVNGDVRITSFFEPDGSEQYKLVWSDEFDGEDYSQPDTESWTRPVRYSAAWNRFIADDNHDTYDKEVVFIRDGKLVCRCIPNPNKSIDKVDMISGARQTSGKVDLTYGYFESRILTNPHAGNFPAFWMMPTDNSAGWPNAGELDIWETINNENTAYHTIHTRWHNVLGNSTPQKAFNEACSNDRYHTFGVEWDETSVSWFLDGKKMCTYRKSTDKTALDGGQWPFDKSFYFILNQSVGNGSWASNPDLTYTYETCFDYVRAYQRPEHIVGVKTTQGDDKGVLSFRTSHGKVTVLTDGVVPITVYDMNGRPAYQGMVNGMKTISLAPGLYVINHSKVTVP